VINARLDQAGLRGDLNLAARFEDLAQTVADALDAGAPRRPAALYWIGLNRDTYIAAGRAGVLSRYRALPAIRRLQAPRLLARHIHVIWELSTLAAEWYRTYGGERR
jgi:hypothetical protein